MADDERVSYRCSHLQGMENEIQELRAQLADKDDEIEKLEEVVSDQEKELDELRPLEKLVDNPDPIVAAQSIVDQLRDRPESERIKVASSIRTGVTSDLWQVFG